jgi:hypothetical protein
MRAARSGSAPSGSPENAGERECASSMEAAAASASTGVHQLERKREAARPRAPRPARWAWLGSHMTAAGPPEDAPRSGASGKRFSPRVVGIGADGL